MQTYRIFLALLVLGWGSISEVRAEVRSIDGSGNNVANPSWGMTNTMLLRMKPAEYMDDMGQVVMAMPVRENPRVLSNAIVSQTSPMMNSSGLTNFVWQWGQFIDHDIDLTGGSGANGYANIPMPSGDILGPGDIPFTRSDYDPATGDAIGNPRQQINEITAYIDGSNIYGSDPSRAAWLRTHTGGMLKTSANGLLPYNVGTQPNAGVGGAPSTSSALFVAGDIRANEQAGLTAMHTLFVREHNRLAGLLAVEMPLADDEMIYQTARRIVGAELQAITYNEFLPSLLGTQGLGAYSGYDSNVNATIANEFSTALFRFGHTMLPSTFYLVDPSDSEVTTLELRNAFFNPTILGSDPTNLDRILGGLDVRAQEIDAHIVDDVRNFLFGPPGAGGMDLASLNIQRGRDHGLADYNSVRQAYGLLPKEKFLTDGLLSDNVTPNGITSDPVMAAKLELCYSDIDNLDPWLAALAEDHVLGSPVGELIGTAIADQFERLRNGDRFFYLNDAELDAAAIQNIIDLSTVSLRDIIQWNTDAQLGAGNLFITNVPEPASLAMLSTLACAFAVVTLRRRLRFPRA